MTFFVIEGKDIRSNQLGLRKRTSLGKQHHDLEAAFTLALGNEKVVFFVETDERFDFYVIRYPMGHAKYKPLPQGAVLMTRTVEGVAANIYAKATYVREWHPFWPLYKDMKPVLGANGDMPPNCTLPMKSGQACAMECHQALRPTLF